MTRGRSRQDHGNVRVPHDTDKRGLSLKYWADLLAATGLIIVGAVAPFVISYGAGDAAIPHNDDWAYRMIATTLYRTTHLARVGWGSMTLVGQVLSVQPLLSAMHGSPVAFSLYGAGAAAVAIVGVYFLARQVLPLGRALIAPGLLILSPGFLATVPTFMTDIPLLAASMWCLALGMSALHASGRRRLAVLGTALVVGIFGFSIREFAIAPIGAVTLAYWAGGASRRWAPPLVLGICAALCVAVYWFGASIPGPLDIVVLSFPRPASMFHILQVGIVLGLAVGPAAVMAIGPQVRRRFHVVVASLLALGLLLLAVVALPWLPGNLLERTGVTGTQVLLGSRPNLFGTPAWATVMVAAGIGTVAVSGVASGLAVELVSDLSGAWRLLPQWRRWIATPEGLLVTFVCCYSGLVGSYVLISGEAFDRYTWPLIGPIAILLLVHVPMARRWVDVGRKSLAAGLVVVLGVVSIALTLNSDAYDAARWKAGQELVAMGVPANEIDAGFEWVGYHDHGAINPHAPIGARDWWTDRFGGPEICAIVSGSRETRASVVLEGVTRYRLLLLGGPVESLYRYRTVRVPGC